MLKYKISYFLFSWCKPFDKLKKRGYVAQKVSALLDIGTGDVDDLDDGDGNDDFDHDHGNIDAYPKYDSGGNLVMRLMINPTMVML